MPNAGRTAISLTRVVFGVASGSPVGNPYFEPDT